MIDIIGKRFLGYLAGLGLGFVACKYLGGVEASKWLDFCAIMFGAYVAGQSATDAVGVFKGIKSLIRP